MQSQVRELGGYLRERQSSISYNFEVGHVSRVEPLGMGHRVCVDLCEEMQPGEGMLVGSFSRGLFLVHSEVRHLCSSCISYNPTAGIVQFMRLRGSCTFFDVSAAFTGLSLMTATNNDNLRSAPKH